MKMRAKEIWLPGERLNTALSPDVVGLLPTRNGCYVS